MVRLQSLIFTLVMFICCYLDCMATGCNRHPAVKRCSSGQRGLCFSCYRAEHWSPYSTTSMHASESSKQQQQHKCTAMAQFVCKICCSRPSELVCMQCPGSKSLSSSSTSATDDIYAFTLDAYAHGQHFCTDCWKRIHTAPLEHDAALFGDWADGVAAAGHACCVVPYGSCSDTKLLLEQATSSCSSHYDGAAVYGRELVISDQLVRRM
jgi:hypothetical protein